jgi:hypothetical protein
MPWWETWRDEQLTPAYRRALVNAHQDPDTAIPSDTLNAYKVAFFAGVKAGLTGANRPQLQPEHVLAWITDLTAEAERCLRDAETGADQ